MDIGFRPRASQEQFSVMLEFMETHGDLSRTQPGPQGRVNNEKLWIQLTELLNSVGSGVQKSTDKWKRVWSDWKTKTKKKALTIAKKNHVTHGEPTRGFILNYMEERVLKIIGVFFVSGHQGAEEAGSTSPVESIPDESSSEQLDMPTFESCDIVIESQDEIGSIRQNDVVRPSDPSSPPHQRVFGKRRKLRHTPSERITGNFVDLEKQRLRLEEIRLKIEHKREMERLRVESLRIEMEERRTTVFEKLVNSTEQIVNLMSQYYSPTSQTLDHKNDNT